MSSPYCALSRVCLRFCFDWWKTSRNAAFRNYLHEVNKVHVNRHYGRSLRRRRKQTPVSNVSEAAQRSLFWTQIWVRATTGQLKKAFVVVANQVEGKFKTQFR